MALTRLSKNYDLAKIIDEVQVITGQLDPEIVPRLSITQHINLATYEVVTLLNQLCAPWYGFSTTTPLLTTAGLVITIPTGTSTFGTANVVNVNGSADTLSKAIDATDAPYIEKVIAVTNNITGTTKKCRDISQFSGIACGGNSQWKKSAAWLHHGNLIHIWFGGSMTTPAFIYHGYRQAIPLDGTSAETGLIDLPDKYVPLVIAKSAVWAMKQAKMGDYQLVEEQINAGIMQIQKEYADGMQIQTAKARSEGIEGL